jgi:PAS domain S-box-containing protein
LIAQEENKKQEEVLDMKDEKRGVKPAGRRGRDEARGTQKIDSMKNNYTMEEKTKEELLKEISELKARIRDLESSCNKAKDFYLAVFDGFPALIWRFGKDTKANYFNKAWLEFRGKSIEEEVGDGWIRGVHPEDLKMCMGVYLAAFNNKKPYKMEYRLKDRNEKYHYMLDIGIPLYGFEGEFLGYIGSCYDIQDRKDFEKRLKDEIVLLQTLINAIPVPVFYKDENKVYLGCNKYFEKIIGKDKKAIIGKTAYDLASEDLAKIYDLKDSELLANPLSPQVYDFSIKYAYSDLREVVFHKAAFLKEDGSLGGLVGAIMDVTEQKIMEQNLLREKKFSETIINSLPGIFYLLDKNGKILRWNTNLNKVTGYTDAELKEMVPFDYFSPAEHSLLKEKIEQAFALGSSSVEVSLLAKDGTKIPYLYTGLKVILEGEPYVVGIGVDISQQKNSEKILNSIKEFYINILENINDGIWVTDKFDKVYYTNSAMLKVSGVSKERILGKVLTQDFPKQTIEYFLPYYLKAKSTLKSVFYDSTPVVTPGNKKTYQSGWLIPLVEDGVFNGMICTVLDVTQNKITSDEIKKKVHDLELFQKISVDRELKMIELKKRIKALEKEQAK